MSQEKVGVWVRVKQPSYAVSTKQTEASPPRRHAGRLADTGLPPAIRAASFPTARYLAA